MTFKASASQLAYFDFLKTGEGNGVVEAVAGSGKTTTLIAGLEYMQGRVFLGAYNAKMASELKGRVENRKDVYASTFHSAGYRQLQFSLKNRALEIDKQKVFKIVTGMKTKRPDLEPVAPYIEGIVSMAKQRGIAALLAAGDPNDNQTWQDMIDHFDLLSDLPEGVRTDQVIPFARAVLKASNEDRSKIDFDDMVYLPLLLRLPMLKHAYVVIDEAQDTNPTRRALAAAMLDRGGRLIAVGDRHQGIFGFTGADNDSLDKITEQFAATKMALSVSYRCPKTVVKVAQRYVDHIESAPDAPEGLHDTCKLGDLYSLVKPGDAILSRYNKYLVQTCFALLREGIASKIEGRKVGNGLMHLAQRWPGVKTLQVLRDKLEGYRAKEVSKATEKENMVRVDAVHDLVDTMQVIVSRLLSQDINSTVTDLCELVKSIFGDEVSSADVVTLCSVHRSKGLEWDHVYILGLEEVMPSPFVTQPWAVQQEVNLQYVAVTRAKKHLTEVTGVKEDRRS